MVGMTGAGVLRNGVGAAARLISYATGAVLEAAAVVPRTVTFLAETSCQRLWGAPHRRDVPVPRVSLSLAFHAAVDRFVVAAHRPWVGQAPAAEVDRVAGEIHDALNLYAAKGWLSDPASYHVTPPPLEEPTISYERTGRIRYERLTFASGYLPPSGEPGRERWLQAAANRTACAWMLRHAAPRPWVVVIHGSGMGYPALDLRVLRALWLHRHMGLNVVLPVLPKHGVRNGNRTPSISFPTDDLLDNVHGLAQAVWDIRRVISWIRRQDGGPVGLVGVSLGGYTAALLAALEREFACVIAAVPVSDFPALFATHLPDGRLLKLDNLERAQVLHRVASPLAIEPQVPPERRFVIGALADGMADPLRQVLPLWEHWERPAALWYEGGHVGYLCTSRTTRFVRDALERSGLAASAGTDG